MLRLAKHGTVAGLLRFSPSCLLACAENIRANLAFKTTVIEDTHLTLIGIPSKIEANNSLILLLLQTHEKKIAEFQFLFLSIIPWCVYQVAVKAAECYKVSSGGYIKLRKAIEPRGTMMIFRLQPTS